MRSATRLVSASLALGLALALGIGAIAHGRVIAYNAHVVMTDNDASFRPAGNPGIGAWGYGPQHISVTQGDQITFENPAGDKQSHTVTSLSWSGQSPYTTLESGTTFNSSPTRDQAIQPGSSWTLDTTTLQPGQYVFYCSLHPWMVGTFTVTAPAGS